MQSKTTSTLLHSVYPEPPTMPGDITPANQAIYIPAISRGPAQYIQAWLQKGSPRQLPNGLTPADLNLFDPNNTVFRISHGLTSAGLALNQKQPCIITQRTKKDTRIVADSGGYQVASGSLKIRDDRDRERILRWQEQFDIAMTLDTPTGPLLRPKDYAFATFQDCLTSTVQHLQFWEKYKSPNSGVVWLNVLQGNNPKQCDIWYDTVRKHFRGQGWAFAGPLRHNFNELLRRILIMIRDGELHEKRWLHILGTSELDTAVLLTALQRALNKHVNENVRISFDTSSPFRNLAHNQAYTIPTFDTKGMTMPTRDAPAGPHFIGSTLRWPWPSPVGDLMTLGDFCVANPRSKLYRDSVSNVLLAHHNLAALCWGIALANRVFDAESIDHNHTIAYPVGLAAEAIELVIRTQSMTELHKCGPIFRQLRHGVFDYDSEDERDF